MAVLWEIHNAVAGRLRHPVPATLHRLYLCLETKKRAVRGYTEGLVQRGGLVTREDEGVHWFTRPGQAEGVSKADVQGPTIHSLRLPPAIHYFASSTGWDLTLPPLWYLRPLLLSLLPRFCWNCCGHLLLGVCIGMDRCVVFWLVGWCLSVWWDMAFLC